MDSPSSGDAAAPTWIVRGDESRPAGTRTFGRDESRPAGTRTFGRRRAAAGWDADVRLRRAAAGWDAAVRSRRVAATPRHSIETGANLRYHLDFFVLGVCIVVTGILGIPPCNGLIPQAPLHTKSLGVLRTEERNGVRVDVVEKTWEQRYTNFGQALLTGVVLFRPLIGILGLVPNAALHGLFIFMALASLPGNELWERVCLVASEPRLRKSTRAWSVRRADTSLRCVAATPRAGTS